MRNYVNVVYKIENKENGKKYIGSSWKIKERFRQHLSALRNNRHPNKELQKDWNEYGEESFKFEVLEIVDSPKVKLEEIEQFYMDIVGKHYLYNQRSAYSDWNKSKKNFKEWLKTI